MDSNPHAHPQPFVFDLKRFAIHDGPGIRTTIFLKGCPLHCVWCHNPEGIKPEAQKLYNAQKCIGCQTCVELCPQQALSLSPQGIVEQPERCIACGQCTDNCPTLALELAGRHWSIDELMKEVEKERQVMETSGGGVTLCGGEPLLQPEAVKALLIELGRRSIHRTLDTTLYCSPATLDAILPHCDLLLIDLKHTDNAKHVLYTGVPNDPILHNIRTVSERGLPYWIRIPLIVGINADEANLHATGRCLSSLPCPPERIDLLPYHDIGRGKHVRLGTTYNPTQISMRPPSAEELEQARLILSGYGLVVS